MIFCVDGRSSYLCLCLVDTCASWVHPVFNSVGPYGYLIHRVFVYVRYRKSRLVCGCRTWSCLRSPAFIRISASHPAGPYGQLAQKSVNRSPIAGAACMMCRLEPHLVHHQLYQQAIHHGASQTSHHVFHL